MQALIIATTHPLAGTDVLGLPLRTRAVFAASDAGARRIELEPSAAQQSWQAALQADPRVTVPLGQRASEAGERLVLRADAVVSPALLRQLEPGESVCDARGTPCAARVHLHAGEDASAALTRARPRPFGGDRYHYALAIEDRSDLRAAQQRLLQSLVKPSDGPVSRHLNRPLSLLITRVCVALGVRPNAMTVLVALAGLLGAYCAAHPEYPAQVLGALLFQLHSIIDGCDGEIARLTRRFGKHGALLDSLVDDTSNTLFFAGLSYGVATRLGSPWPLYTGAFTVACYVAVAYVQYAVVLRTTGKGEKTAFWQGSLAQKPLWQRALHSLGRRDVFVFVILLAVAAGLSPLVVAVLPAMAFGALAQSSRRAFSLRKSA